MTTLLKASPETCAWGYFDAGLPPVAEVNSGDTIEIETVSGSPEQLPPEGFHVPPELLDIHARSPRQLPGLFEDDHAPGRRQGVHEMI